MNINTLKHALLHYALSIDNANNELYETIGALTEVSCIQDYLAKDEEPNMDVTLITATNLADILNVLTYDTYGKIKHTCTTAPFRLYARKCREQYGLDYLTNAQLQDGFDFIQDLWQDNEDSGCNNKDGTFNGTDTPAIYNALVTIKDLVSVSANTNVVSNSLENQQAIIELLKIIDPLLTIVGKYHDNI